MFVHFNINVVYMYPVCKRMLKTIANYFSHAMYYVVLLVLLLCFNFFLLCILCIGILILFV